MPFRVLKLSLVLLAALAGHAAIAQPAQRSIFDDDWKPPKPSSAPRTTPAGTPTPGETTTPPTTTPKPPDSPTTPAPGETTPPTTTPPPPAVPAVPARKPVPPKAEQAASRKLMKELFAEQLSDRSPAGRRKLTEALLKQADASASIPAEQFVLLAAAGDAALDAGSLPLAFAAADRMAATFDVDVLGVKADAVASLRPVGAAVAGASGAENVRAALDLADELAAADDFASAVRVCTAAQPIAVAAGNAELRGQVQKRLREVGLARDAADRVARHFETLRAAPDDPAANLAVGRYACFVKGDWDGGLLLLAKGSDPLLKGLAAQELALPKGGAGGDAVARVADAWWDAAARQGDAAAKAAVTAHAAALYKESLASATGLRRAQIEKRLADAAREPAVATASAKTRAGGGMKDIIVEALIDGATKLHVTPDGLYWTIHGPSKPGLHGGRNEPTFVNGVAWTPKWGKPGERGDDRSDGFALRVPAGGTLKAEVVACDGKRGTDKVDKRDPIRQEVNDGEFVVTIPDGQGGSKWYRLKITREP